MSNLIDLDNLTLKDVEKLKKALGIDKETEEQAMLRRAQEVGTRPGYMPVLQVNAGGKRYFFKKEEEEREFLSTCGYAEVESFKIELPISTARKYFEETENVLKKGKKNVG